MEIVPYDKKYLERFSYNGIERDYISVEEARAKIEFNASLGECYAGLIDDNPVMFCGVIPLHSGVLQAWLYLNTEADKNSHLSDLLTFGKYLLWDKRFRRVQTLCISGSEKAETLLKHFGFKFEGILKKFLDNADMSMYALLPQGKK